MELREKQLESEQLFNGRIIKVYRDIVDLPNGKTAFREVVRHPGGVIILPVDGGGNVYMVCQFRYPFDRTLLEIPAGKLEYGEEPFSAAQRELEEEIGATAERWTPLGNILPTPGFCDEVHYLWLARGLTFGETHPDEDEFLEQVKLPFGEAFAMAADGRLQDSKTVVALLRAKLLMEEERNG